MDSPIFVAPYSPCPSAITQTTGECTMENLKIDELISAMQDVDALMYAYEILVMAPSTDEEKALHAECLFYMMREKYDKLKDILMNE